VLVSRRASSFVAQGMCSGDARQRSVIQGGSNIGRLRRLDRARGADQHTRASRV